MNRLIFGIRWNQICGVNYYCPGWWQPNLC
jgi:hypothetical protein